MSCEPTLSRRWRFAVCPSPFSSSPSSPTSSPDAPPFPHSFLTASSALVGSLSAVLVVVASEETAAAAAADAKASSPASLLKATWSRARCEPGYFGDGRGHGNSSARRNHAHTIRRDAAHTWRGAAGERMSSIESRSSLAVRC